MESHLTKAQGATLLQLARQTLTHRLSGGHPPDSLVEPDFLNKRAVFVTLKRGGKLRGCIGNLIPTLPLWEGVRDNALNAAFHDHRFAPLAAEDLDSVIIEISVLTTPQRLPHRGGDDLLAKLRVGVDGVILKKDGRSATFLPQVWDQLPRPEDFLSHLCMKAGLTSDAWKISELEVLTYQVQYFEETH